MRVWGLKRRPERVGGTRSKSSVGLRDFHGKVGKLIRFERDKEAIMVISKTSLVYHDSRCLRGSSTGVEDVQIPKQDVLCRS